MRTQVTQSDVVAIKDAEFLTQRATITLPHLQNPSDRHQLFLTYLVYDCSTFRQESIKDEEKSSSIAGK